MLKSGKGVLQLLDPSRPPLQRLAIAPILDPETQIDPAAASVDLRLGCTFVVPNRSQLVVLDPISNKYEDDKIQCMDKVYVNIGESFVLHPRQFVLASTLEWIHMPLHLAAYVIGRSTWGRDGLIIATAAGVHPGYVGTLTLELTNLGEVPLKLYPGLRYVQLFFHEVELPGTRQATSEFLGSTEPTSGRPSSDERGILNWFGRRLGVTPDS